MERTNGKKNEEKELRVEEVPLAVLSCLSFAPL
jgi:hypothetical protein